MRNFDKWLFCRNIERHSTEQGCGFVSLKVLNSIRTAFHFVKNIEHLAPSSRVVDETNIAKSGSNNWPIGDKLDA